MSSKGKRWSLRGLFQRRPETREVAAAQVTDKYSEYPSDGLTPVRLAEIFKEADAGDVLRQAELFEEMEEKDPHLFSQLQTRKNAVTGLDYEIIPFDSDDPRDKEIAEFVEAQLGGIEGFEDIMLDLLDAIGKGFAVSEIMWSYDEGHVVVGDIRSRHQKRFFWDSVDDSFKVRTQEAPRASSSRRTSSSYTNTRPAAATPPGLAFCAWSPGCTSLRTTPSRIGSRFARSSGCRSAWGSISQAQARTTSGRSCKPSSQSGRTRAGIFPDGTAIEFVNTEKTSSTDLYERLARYCDEQVSKAILGQTLTSDSGGGSYAQSKTHNDVRHDLTVADCKAIAATLRRDLIRPLVLYNFGEDKRIPYLRFDAEESEDLTQTATVIGTLIREAGLKVPTSYIYKKFSIPKPEGDEEVATPPGQTAQGAGFGPFSFKAQPASRSRSRPGTERGTGRKSASTVWRQRPPGKAPGPSRKRSARFSKRLRTRRALRSSGT